uniref:Uncharacterized protein n=1 Tax=Oryza rufipogon TaxID=4529 RepID=A0A0E0NC15_ORYRU
MVVEHRSASCGLAGGDWRVKTQPSLDQAGNDDRRSVMLSGGRFGASLLLDLCVGVAGVWVVVYFFSFPGYDFPGL